MPKTIQIRDVDDDVYDELARRAAAEGFSVPEFLRREAERLVARPSLREWAEETATFRTDLPPGAVQRALEEVRGPWPGDE